MTKRKPNFKSWGNVLSVLVAKPAKKAAKKAVKKARVSTVKGLRKAVGLSPKGKRK